MAYAGRDDMKEVYQTGPAYTSPPAPPPKTSPHDQNFDYTPPPHPSGPTSSAQYAAPEYRRPQELDGTSRPIPGISSPLQSSEPQVPSIETSWLPSILQSHSTSDLHALLENPALQTSLLENPATTHPAVIAAQDTIRPVLEANLVLAQSLLELEQRVRQTREQTQSRLLSLRALEQQHRTKLAETESALQNFSPGALYKRLAASVIEQEALVQGLEQSWLEEGGEATDREVAEIVRRIRETKKIAFLRRERRERWDEGRVGGWR